MWLTMCAGILLEILRPLSGHDAYVYNMYNPAALGQTCIAFYPLLVIYHHRILRKMVRRALPCRRDEDGDSAAPKSAPSGAVVDQVADAQRIAALYFAHLHAQWSRC